ncbi:hypothetical protein KSP40_PGU004769 [Platanthera guangdongensis]|uniref:Ribosomal protein S14 n=1 Tax=Platanthera guangdongensis TaxID=2320717 RepID=A0ABR2LQL6_9ASPA
MLLQLPLLTLPNPKSPSSFPQILNVRCNYAAGLTLRSTRAARRRNSAGGRSRVNNASNEDSSVEESSDMGVRAALSMLKFYKNMNFLSAHVCDMTTRTKRTLTFVETSRDSMRAKYLKLIVRRNITASAIKLPLCANLQCVLDGGIQTIRRCKGYNLDNLAPLPLQPTWWKWI